MSPQRDLEFEQVVVELITWLKAHKFEARTLNKSKHDSLIVKQRRRKRSRLDGSPR